MFTRTITDQPPQPPKGAEWQATALLEAPDNNGEPGDFTAIEATIGIAETVETRHAQHNPGWYRLQWYSSANTSAYSDPAFLDGEVASNTRRSRR